MRIPTYIRYVSETTMSELYKTRTYVPRTSIFIGMLSSTCRRTKKIASQNRQGSGKMILRSSLTLVMIYVRRVLLDLLTSSMVDRKRHPTCICAYNGPAGRSGLSTWKYQFSYDHWSQATLSLVSTWMGDCSSVVWVLLLSLKVGYIWLAVLYWLLALCWCRVSNWAVYAGEPVD